AVLTVRRVLRLLAALPVSLRMQEWSAIQARKAVWLDLESHCLSLWERASRLRGSFQRRMTPLPNGPIEDYTATSEKLAMASFSVDRKSTRLNSSHVKISYA